jgi:hypothetical protein
MIIYSIYGIPLLLGDVGGFYSAMIVIGLFFAKIFSKRLFTSAVIK